MFTIFSPISPILVNKQDDDSNEINQKRDLYKKQLKAKVLQAKDREAARISDDENESQGYIKENVLENFKNSLKRHSASPCPALVKEHISTELHADYLMEDLSENNLSEKDDIPHERNKALAAGQVKISSMRKAETVETLKDLSPDISIQLDPIFQESQDSVSESLKRIDDKLNSDIFYSDPNSLIKNLEKLRRDFSKISDHRQVPENIEKGPLPDGVGHKDLHATLNFLEGYFEKDFSAQADRDIFKNALNEFRAAIEYDRSLMDRAALGAVVGSSASTFVQKSYEARLADVAVGLASNKRRTLDLNQSDAALAAEYEASDQSVRNSARNIALTEFLNDREKKIARKNKENTDTTLPLVVQRSA